MTMRSPLALVVEDDEDFRENIIVPQLTQFGVRVVTATNALDGVGLAADHGRGSTDPLDVVILDMHIPLTPEEGTPCMEGGILAMRQYADLEVSCPVVVFTAFPSYSNCVAAIQAGALAYIPKAKHETPMGGKEGGIDHLIDVCKRLLAAKSEDPPRMPPRDWQQDNGSWLQRRFLGKWVAFFKQADVEQEAGFAFPPENIRDGIVILSGDTREEVSRQVLRWPALFKARPPIAMVGRFERGGARSGGHEK